MQRAPRPVRKGRTWVHIEEEFKRRKDMLAREVTRAARGFPAGPSPATNKQQLGLSDRSLGKGRWHPLGSSRGGNQSPGRQGGAEGPETTAPPAHHLGEWGASWEVGGRQVAGRSHPGCASLVRHLEEQGRRTQASGSGGAEGPSPAPPRTQSPGGRGGARARGAGAGGRCRRVRRREGSGRERVGAHVQVPRSCPSRPSASAPPLPRPSLDNASSALAARALTSGTPAGADWADSRVRESGSTAQLSSYSGNRVSNPAGRGEKGSGAQRRACPRPPPDNRRIHLSANSLPPLLPPKLWLSRESGTCPRPFPVSPSPVLAHSHPRHSHKPQRPAATLSCLVTDPRVPSPVFTSPGRRRRTRAGAEMTGNRKSTSARLPLRLLSRPRSHLTPLSSANASRPRHLVATSGRSSTKNGPSPARAGNARGHSEAGPGVPRRRDGGITSRSWKVLGRNSKWSKASETQPGLAPSDLHGITDLCANSDLQLGTAPPYFREGESQPKRDRESFQALTISGTSRLPLDSPCTPPCSFLGHPGVLRPSLLPRAFAETPKSIPSSALPVTQASRPSERKWSPSFQTPSRLPVT